MKFGTLGGWELLLIVLVLVLLFGARRLPDVAKGIGQSVREFRKGIKGDEEVPEKRDDTTV